MKKTTFLFVIGVLFAGGCAGGKGAIRADMDTLTAAYSAYQARDLDTAERLYERVAKRKGAGADVFLRLGNIAMLRREPNRAALRYDQALAIDPRHARAHYNLATIYLQRSEEHMHYFVALSDDTDLNDSLVSLLAQMEEFSRREQGGEMPAGNPLDELAKQLAQDGGSP